MLKLGIVVLSDDAAGAAGIPPPYWVGQSVVEGHRRVGGAELVGVVIRGRRRGQGGLGAVPLLDMHGCGHS